MSDYINLARVKADLGITKTDRDIPLADAISAASREIDGYTGTTFKAGAASARLFEASRCGTRVWVDRFTDPTDLVVKTGSNGTYGTTIDVADYMLWPYNAPARGMAYCRIDVPGALLFRELGRPGVEVTAKWGWADVPDDVEQATRIRAIQLFHRRESPHGVASFGDDPVSGSTVTIGADPDVRRLLAPYALPGIA